METDRLFPRLASRFARDGACLALALAIVPACVTRPTDDGGAPEVAVDGRVLGDALDATAAEQEGLDRLANGDFQGALVALRLAEDRVPARRDAIRVEEARALHLMGLDESALTTLEQVFSVGLTDDGAATNSTARRGLALAGVIYAGRDALVRAEDLLARALAADDTWPGAARARADLGVVLLRMGDDVRGVAELKTARVMFQARGDEAGAGVVEQNLLAWAMVTGAGPTE